MKSSHQARVICEVCWVAFVIEALSRPCCQNPLFSSLFFYFLRFFFHVPSLHPPDLPLQLPKPLLISDKLAWSPFSSCWALLWVPVQDLFFFFPPLLPKDNVCYLIWLSQLLQWSQRPNHSFPFPAAKAFTHNMPHILCHRESGIPNNLPCSLFSAWQDTSRATFELSLGLFQNRMLTLCRVSSRFHL